MHSKALKKLSRTTKPKPTTVTTDQKDNNMLFYSLVALSSVTLTTLAYFGYRQYKKKCETTQDRDCVEDLVIDMTSVVSYVPGQVNENKLEVEELPENDDEL